MAFPAGVLAGISAALTAVASHSARTGRVISSARGTLWPCVAFLEVPRVGHHDVSHRKDEGRGGATGGMLISVLRMGRRQSGHS